MTLKLGQNSSKIEASWPEPLLRFLTGIHFSSEWLWEIRWQRQFCHFVVLVFRLPENYLKMIAFQMQ